MGVEEKVNNEDSLLVQVSLNLDGQPYVPCPENPNNPYHRVYTRSWNRGLDKDTRKCSGCGKVYSVVELLELNTKSKARS